jgi:uncharacterized membrane protein
MSVFTEFLITLMLAFIAGAMVQRFARKSISLSPRWFDRATHALIAGYILLFTALTLLRYLSFNVGYLDDYTSWDLGQYDQIIWNSLNGRLFENSFIPDAPNFLGKTFAPILLAFVPLYALWSTPIVLLVVQTVALALGALPIYWFARVRIGRGLALVLVIAYLLSPAIQNTNVAEFHEVALLTPFLAYTTFFLLRRHYPGFLVCLALSLLVKEEVAFIVVMFGAYIFLFQRQRVFGAGLALFGVAWTLLLLQYVIPFFRTGVWGGKFYYFGEGALTGGRYDYLGKSVGEILTTLLTRPDIIFAEIFQPSKMAYVLHLIVPLALVPIVGFEISAISLPTFAYTLLSRYPHQQSLAAAYHAPILPFLFFGAAVGLARVMQWKWRHTTLRPMVLGTFVLVASICSYWLEAPGPFARKFQPNRYVLNEHTAIGHRLIGLIPPGGIVAAQNELIAYVTNHRYVYEIPLIDYRRIDHLLADSTRGWYKIHESFWEPYLASGYFEIVAEQDGWVVAKRREPIFPVNVRFADKLTLLAYTMVPADSFRGGETLRPFASWRAEENLSARYTIQVDLVDQAGHVWQSDTREPQDGKAPTSQWRAGDVVQDQYALHLDHTMPSGEYRIVIRVLDAQKNFLITRDEIGKALGNEFTLTKIFVEKSKASLMVGQVKVEQPLAADLAELRLIGFVPPRSPARAGEKFSLGLYWRAHTKPRGDYLVAVQLRDANGRVAFEQRARPAQGTYATNEWNAGEVLLDWHDFDLPRELVPGDYQIFVVLRDAATQIPGEATITTITIVR